MFRIVFVVNCLGCPNFLALVKDRFRDNAVVLAFEPLFFDVPRTAAVAVLLIGLITHVTQVSAILEYIADCFAGKWLARFALVPVTIQNCGNFGIAILSRCI